MKLEKYLENDLQRLLPKMLITTIDNACILSKGRMC